MSALPKMPPAEVAVALTPQEAEELARCEAEVEEGMETFFRVGEALETIRDRQLFKGTHGTFEAYVKDRFRFTAGRARQLIGAFKAVEATGEAPRLLAAGLNEKNVRPVVAIHDPEAPERTKDVFDAAIRLSEEEGRPLSGRHVREAVEAVVAPEPEAPQGENPDEAYVRQFKLYHELGFRPKGKFRTEALKYRDTVAPIVERLRKALRFNAGGERTALYYKLLPALLPLDPSRWKLCLNCRGGFTDGSDGFTPAGNVCEACHGNGFTC